MTRQGVPRGKPRKPRIDRWGTAMGRRWEVNTIVAIIYPGCTNYPCNFYNSYSFNISVLATRETASSEGTYRMVLRTHEHYLQQACCAPVHPRDKPRRRCHRR